MKNIETKFNPQDKIWAIIEGKAKEMPVKKISIDIESDKIQITYMVNIGTQENYKPKILDEDRIFASREELIENL